MIKVTLGEKPKEEKPFPKLMRVKDYYDNNGKTIVLFIEHRLGTVINNQNGYHEVGYYYEKWDMSQFEELNEPITLQNA